MAKLIRQPEGSSLCGQCCVAMAARVSLRRAIEVIGHANGTHTLDIVAALHSLNVDCAFRLKRIGRAKPVIPARALVVIYRPGGESRSERAHWMYHHRGEMLD